MKSFITLLAGAAIIAATPVLAQQANTALQNALASETRDEDRARDAFRHPAETLNFFQVKPEHTVLEYAPGGGWYTRLLVPYIAPNGRYLAMNGDSDARTYRDRASEARSKGWTERFPAVAAEWTGMPVEKITAFESDEVPEDVTGQVDRVVIFRSMHGLLNGNRADTELRAIRSLLKDDGMVGVVQHRAKADAPWEISHGTRGYLKEAQVIALFALHGFELAGKSEINANAKDPANWEGGVWTLPPVLRYEEENRAQYEAIGESDRMTLLFRKAD
jgi:predicted methyltransferase